MKQNRNFQETHDAFVEEAERSGRERLQLTAAVSAGEGTIRAAYDIPEIAKFVLFVLSFSRHVTLMAWYFLSC